MGFVADAPAGRFVPDEPPAPKQNPVTVTKPQPTLAEMDPGAAVYEVPRAVVQNTAANAASGFAGLAGTMLPGPPGQGARFVEKTRDALSFEPTSPQSKAVLEAIGKPGELFSRYVSKPIGARGAQVSPALGTIGETSAEAIPQLLGARAALKPTKPLTHAQERVAAARDSGFTMTPEEMGAGTVPRTMASLSGEPRLAKLTTRKNTAVAVEKAKKELGVPAEATLDLDRLADIRKEAGKSYETIRGVGEVKMDPTYYAEVDALGQKYRSAAKDFPGLAPADVEQVVKALKQEGAGGGDPWSFMSQNKAAPAPKMGGKFDANSAVDLMGQLRESADGAFRSGNTGLAKVLRGGAAAVENQLERHLQTTGQADALKNFRAARQRIAKSYSVEDSLVADDAVNLRELGRQFSDRKPLTGGLKESGEFARNFERSSQKPSHMPTGATMHDLILSGVNAARTGGGSLALDALTVGARPAARSIIASPPAQWMMDPRTNLSAPTLGALGVSQALPPPQEKTP